MEWSAQERTVIEMIQNIQRQPKLSATNPPAIGPTTGPNIGPMAQMAMTPALFSRVIMSAAVPDPIVIGQLPATPDRKRKTKS